MDWNEQKLTLFKLTQGVLQVPSRPFVGTTPVAGETGGKLMFSADQRINRRCHIDS